ncbi:aldehyde dehydrogenase (NADP(+)) [Winogradskyella aurantiaca]|uniref:aldehyde dehydrogenase (NADP(+)) n=1 Tax=Winogradskyella aurantiaca TaxID=2219558 RepID=UPI000E1C783B|nr:aldehyde dehydrogenase (NADP(+)) [Winogradskyella aurantiaca]
MITGNNYIGSNLSDKGTKTFFTFNPITDSENSWQMIEASESEVEAAIELAADAAADFAKVSGADKAEFLNAIADEIMALGDELISTYCAETGLPEGRAKGERGRTVFQLRSFANLVAEGSWVEASIDTAIPDRTPAPKPDLRKMNIPLGPVVVFGASNFPLAYSTAGGDTTAALAAGCPVIVKSHPMHAGTGELVASAIIKAAKDTQMPDGIFSNLNSAGIEVGVQLVKHPFVKAVGFTGSIRGGRALLDLAAQREEPIPVFAEMGSINPVVILPEALNQRTAEIAKTYAGSITLGSGQFCTNPGLILGLKSAELDTFIESLGTEITQLESSVMLHPDIHSAYESNKETALDGPEVTTVAALAKEVPVNYSQQAIATVNGSEFLINPTLHQEVFGPFSMVVQCQDTEEMELILLNLEGQLTGTLIAEETELEAYEGVIDSLQNRVGRLIYNGVPTGVEVCPSMVHGGPYPASTDSRFTAVGIHSIKRWVRPFSYQNWPDALLPDALKNGNPLGIERLVDGETTKKVL